MRSPRLLLDVNVWIALFDDQHVHNHRALSLIEQPGLKIATCPLIENAVLRITNMPSYNRLSPAGFDVVRQKMELVCRDTNHEFWPDDISLRADPVLDWERVSGHNQITDAYLLALALKHRGCLATFDQRIALSAVRGAKSEHLKLL
jgi:uncharacterized protein